MFSNYSLNPILLTLFIFGVYNGIFVLKFYCPSGLLIYAMLVSLDSNRSNFSCSLYGVSILGSSYLMSNSTFLEVCFFTYSSFKTNITVDFLTFLIPPIDLKSVLLNTIF